MVEKPHSDGLCGKSVVVINNSSEYISPGDGTCPARFHSGCWSLLVDPLMGWWKHTRLAGEVALEFRTYVVFPPYRGGQLPSLPRQAHAALFITPMLAQTQRIKRLMHQTTSLDFVDYYNHQGYHESLDNLTPEDTYFGRVEEMKKRRELIKEKTMQKRRVENIQTVCV